MKFLKHKILFRLVSITNAEQDLKERGIPRMPITDIVNGPDPVAEFNRKRYNWSENYLKWLTYSKLDFNEKITVIQRQTSDEDIIFDIHNTSVELVKTKVAAFANLQSNKYNATFNYTEPATGEVEGRIVKIINLIYDAEVRSILTKITINLFLRIEDKDVFEAIVRRVSAYEGFDKKEFGVIGFTIEFYDADKNNYRKRRDIGRD